MNSQNLQQIIEVADMLNRLLRKLVITKEGIHAETIVSAAARMAGTMLFRSFGDEAADLPAGSVVISDRANQQGPKLTSTLFAVLRQYGHTELDEQNLNGAQETTALARLTLKQTQSLLEPWYRRAQETAGLSFEDVAFASVMTTAMLIHDCRAVLDVHSGCAIAIHGIVESAKTVPAEYAVGA